jgi:hypothetical protein
MPQPTTTLFPPASAAKIPLALKIAFTVFMIVLVPFYWRQYGPTNFLYFCDVALFFTLAAVWTEKPLLASMPAVGILVPQALWCVDFIGSAFGAAPVGMTGYMFDSNITLFARGLSFFHFWLPFLLVYLVYKLGYDRRAWLAWTILAWALITFCYLLMPAPPAPAGMSWMPVNINYVYGMNDKAPQTWMHPHAWFALLFAALPVVVYLPTHWLLKRWYGSDRKALHPATR